MRNVIVMVYLLLGYTFIYAGLSEFHVSWVASPKG